MSLVVTAILSRLLTPNDFGTVAIATVLISFFGLFTDIGMSAAIVQHKELTEDDISNIFSFTCWSGVLLSVCFFAASWSIGAYYHSPQLGVICRWLTVNIFFASLNIVPNALFFKAKRFKFIAMRSLVVQSFGGGIAIVAALCGAGLYALVINPIISCILIFGISIRQYPQKLAFTSGITTIKKIFAYSAYQFLFNVINYFSRNLDKLLIGRYLSMDLLGYYEKSYRLMMLPLQNITQVITPVMHPVFSDYRNDLKRLAEGYEKIIRLLAFIGFPLSILLFFSAHELIFILFGPQWEPAVPVFEVLAWSVGIQIVVSSSGAIFQSAGDTRSLFVCGAFGATLNVMAILTGIFVFRSLTATAWCITLSFTLGFAQCYWMLYKVTIRRSLTHFIRQFLSPLILSGVLILILYPLSVWLEGTNNILSLIVKTAVALLAYATYIQLTKTYNLIAQLKKMQRR